MVVLLWGLLVSLAAGAQSQVPNFRLSEIVNQDISQQLRYQNLPNAALPDSRIGLEDWLDTLGEHQGTNPFGDRYLAAFSVTNDTEQANWFVYPYGSTLERVDIKTYDASDHVQHSVSGLTYRNQIDFHYGGHVTLPPGQTVTMLILFDSDFFVSPIKVVLHESAVAEYRLNNENIVLLLSLGVCIALAIYNLFIFGGSGEKQYLYYALATIMFTLGWAQAMSVVAMFVPAGHLFGTVSPFLVGFIFIALFGVEFLQLRQNNRRLYWILAVLAAISLMCVPIALVSTGAGVILASLLSTFIMLVSMYAGIRAWRNGYAPAKYFVVALLSVMIPNLIGNLMNLYILPGYNVNVYLMSQLGNSMDSLLLAFALAAKVRLINSQNLALTCELEYNVAQRTHQLSEANARLEELIEELKQANAAKSHFLANMSHEIRTPLTSIIGYADAMTQGDYAESEHPRVTKIIGDSGKHLLSVINDILDLSKIEANKLDFEKLPTPIFDVVNQIESAVQQRAKDKGIAFTLHYDFPLPAQVTTDPTRLRQILFNLTNNALKFTDVGFVSLTVCIKEASLLFIVKDSGIGLSDEKLKLLFNPFQQGDNSIARKYGGTGLGLSISQLLAEGLGGHIDVQSQEGRGAEFSLQIPLDVPAASEYVQSLTQIEQSQKPVLPTPEQSVLPKFKRCKVLVCDDQPNIRELVANLLKRMDVEVLQAGSGQQAMQLVSEQHDLDLILMDIQMPGLDGVQTLDRIRALESDVPIVALTANSMEHEVKGYLQHGFTAHLAKPIVRAQFIEMLKQFLPFAESHESMLTEQDKLALCSGYYQDLLEKLPTFTTELGSEEQMAFAHYIKGSASSFGFAPLTEAFTLLETALKQHDKGALQTALADIAFLRNIIMAQRAIDLPHGIVSHGYDMGQYIINLTQTLSVMRGQFELLSQAAVQHNAQNVRHQMYNLIPQLRKFGLQTALDSTLAIKVNLLADGLDWEFIARQIEKTDVALENVSNLFSRAA